MKLRARPKPWAEELVQEEEKLVRAGDYFRGEVQKWSAAAFAALPEVDRKLHAKAFTTNESDPDFRRLEEVRYDDGGTVRTMKVPRGDVLHQFRRETGDLRDLSFETISGSGPNGASPHHELSDRVIEQGDPAVQLASVGLDAEGIALSIRRRLEMEVTRKAAQKG